MWLLFDHGLFSGFLKNFYFGITKLKHLNRFFCICKFFLLPHYVTRSKMPSPVQLCTLMEVYCYIYIPNVTKAAA